MNWTEEYQKKLVSPEEAVSVIKSGDRVVVPLASEPMALGLALAARAAELRGVEIYIGGPTRDLGWYDEWARDAFDIVLGFLPRYAPPAARRMALAKQCDYRVFASSLSLKALREDRSDARRVDVCLLETSPPDAGGFCSFGNSVWDKKSWAESAEIVVAEVNRSFIRTYGGNSIHMSQIDRFVEGESDTTSAFTNVAPLEIPPEAKAVAEHVSSLIRDGDTIQVGVGTLTEALISAGALDGKRDLGYHSERIPRGGLQPVQEGIVNGKRKSVDTGKVVATCIPLGPGDEALVNGNPAFELYDWGYTNDIRVIAAQDNMVAINGALAIDLTGQVASESVGFDMYSGAGGLPEFAIGAVLARGGRCIIVLPSTTSDGRSRIVLALATGTAVTVTRQFVDYVVTEYGIARLLGKTQRERVQELVGVAHPQFRQELYRDAQRLYWP
ncbi:MAG: acetyl-CoA hydrolase/transferase family protein [Chloroflexi bacterium]|nr:acetyl-CoA hydrolase/transferase family protein [Chloroflexota bacterium]